MTLGGLLLLLLIAGVCGSLAQALVGYSHGGCLASIALGFIGAILGTWLAELIPSWNSGLSGTCRRSVHAALQRWAQAHADRRLAFECTTRIANSDR